MSTLPPEQTNCASSEQLPDRSGVTCLTPGQRWTVDSSATWCSRFDWRRLTIYLGTNRPAKRRNPIGYPAPDGNVFDLHSRLLADQAILDGAETRRSSRS